jgi:Ethylbenzene dehydrogenase
MKRTYLTLGLAGAAGALSTLAVVPAALAVDWSAVKPQQVVLIYPGQTSFEWALTPKDHSAAPKFRQGKNCKACHLGEEEKYGVPLAAGKQWEPHPIPGKRGFVPLEVQWAHDDKALYLRVQWQGVPPSKNPPMDKDYAAKLSVILDDGKVPTFDRAGCWAVCHDDQTGMASAGSATREKYLAESRVRIRRSGGGDALRPQGVLDKMLASGHFVELWQARLNPGAPAVAVDGYILAKRHMSAKPAVTAKASYAGGKWTVEMSRPLKAPGPGYKDLVPGKTYTVGLALHEDHAEGRYHEVSWEYTLALDSGKADFIAARH